MSDRPSAFVWYELMTSDVKAAKAFYGDVLGWGAIDVGDYVLWTAADVQVGGLMPVPPEAAAMGVGPSWSGYIAVADVDAKAAEITAAGGYVYKAGEDIPDIGRFAVVADPQRAAFVLFKPFSDAGPTPAPPGTPGHIGWRELMAADAPAAFDFYAKLFGWTKTQAFDMGPMGAYQLFGLGDGESIGGMMTKPVQDAGPPRWRYAFNVADIDAAAARVLAGGGQIVNGPHQVPTGTWVAQAFDPQGAFFALVGPRKG
jgi:predicted enzyme related to lactoylglutathione lyase